MCNKNRGQKIKKILKNKLRHFFLNKGIILQRATDKSNVLKLLEDLYPIRSEFELIRLGPNGDGGYLTPNDLEGIEACFSPGVDKISGFELDCLKYKMKVFMADKSVEMPNLDISEEEYNFIKKFVGCTNNDEFITIDDWVKSSDISDSSDLLLQMDIEGGEYNSIINMTDSLINRFRIMVIEFHSLQDLWNPHFFSLNKTVFDKILQTHICVHIHPNNCCGIHSQFGVEIPRIAEFTFTRKDRIKIKNYETIFPHSLDFDNTKNGSISLPKDWYKST
jgi:hypothetical protein